MPELNIEADPTLGPGISVGREVPLEATQGEAYPDIAPEPVFLFYWTPGKGAYCVRRLSDGTPVLVPTIKILRGYPGVGAVDTGVNGEVDFSKQTVKIRRKGGVVLDAAFCRQYGIRSYLRAHQCAKKDGKGNATFYHLPPWRFPKRTRSGAWKIDCDEDMKTKWEEKLFRIKAIPMPEDADLREILEARSRRLDRHANRADPKEAQAYDLEKADQAAEIRAIEGIRPIDELESGLHYAAPVESNVPATKEPLDG